MTAILLNSLLPIFAVLALGYFAGWVRDIDNQHVGELNAQPSGFLGVRYGVESHEAGSTLIISIVLSALTLAVALMLTAGN
jgi:predicted permease